MREFEEIAGVKGHPAMSLKSDVARAEVARDRLGSHLDEIESRFMPQYVWRIGRAWATHSAKKHPAAWTLGGTAVAATVLGLLGWAIFSRDD